MAYLSHIFAAIGLFFASLFGHHPAPASITPSGHAALAPTGTATATATSSAASAGLSVTPSEVQNGYVSFNGQPIQGADPTTFTPLTDSSGKTDYAKDKNHVYLGASIVMGADPATFTVVSGPSHDAKDNVTYYYAKDENNVYINNLVISGADPTTFVAVKGSATVDAKDKNRSYLYGRPL